jgi:hypothetical protein
MTKPSGADANGYDSVGLTNLLAIGLGPSLTATNSYLAHSHSLSILWTNSVQEQHQQAIAGLAITSRCVTQLFGDTGNRRREPRLTTPPLKATSDSGIVAPSVAEPKVSSFHHEPYYEAPYKEPPYKEPPYTESAPSATVSK